MQPKTLLCCVCCVCATYLYVAIIIMLVYILCSMPDFEVVMPCTDMVMSLTVCHIWYTLPFDMQ